VYAFKFDRGFNNVIQCQWKKAACDPFWRGADHQVNSPGFILLGKFPPRTAPDVIPANVKCTSTTYVREATGATMQQVATDHLGSEELAAASMEWVRISMETGSMPYTLYPNQPPVSKAEWGPRVKVGVPGHEGDFYVMQADENTADFWTLPNDLKERADLITVERQRALDQVNQLPSIRYTKAIHQRQVAANNPTTGNLDATQVLPVNDSKESEEKPRDFGADLSMCEVGHFAIKRARYDGGTIPGIEIIEITEVCKTGPGVKEGYETFDGTRWGPHSKTHTETHPRCLEGTWNADLTTKPTKKRKKTNVASKQPTEEPIEQPTEQTDSPAPNLPHNCYDVLVYFKKFNTSRKLPKRVVDDLYNTVHYNKVTLFEEQEHEDEYEF
jgi:hypothetical protein